MRTLTGEICLTQRAYDDYRASDPKTFFGHVGLKQSALATYQSVMHFEDRLASGLEEIGDLFHQSTWFHEEPFDDTEPNESFVLNYIEYGYQVDFVYTAFSKASKDRLDGHA
jgi:hypothetical protein